MRSFKYTVTSQDMGKQIKNIIRRNLSISASALTELKKDPNGILLNGESVYATKTVKENDVIEINLQDFASQNILPKYIPLDILYEDEDILCVNKPFNMPVHPSCNHHEDTLANAVMYYYKNMPFTFRAITRLDKDTTGVVLIAKNKISAGILSKAINDGKIKKEYVALCHNKLPKDKGEINSPIGRKAGSAILREVSFLGKSARTLYEIIDTKGEISLVRLIPLTGRTHQLRVHLSYMGCPIFGDDLYGSPTQNERCRLHCQKLSFVHPATMEEIEIVASIPDDMK